MVEKGHQIKIENHEFENSLNKVKSLYFKMYGRGQTDSTKLRYDKEVDKKITKYKSAVKTDRKKTEFLESYNSEEDFQTALKSIHKSAIKLNQVGYNKA